MMRLLGLGLGLTLVATAACGDNDTFECGAGTEADNGVCLPVCGPGLARADDGTCVPDGSVICTGGTIFDVATSTCVIDPEACQGGTVLIDGECRDPAEGLTIDAEEAPEPNGLLGPGEIAGFVDLPAIGAGAFVMHGCVTPYLDDNDDGNLDTDTDAWVLSVPAPTALRITADGVGGLAAGFLVQPTNATLGDQGWQRFGVNLSGDLSRRELYLPIAGTYILSMGDSRSFFLDAAGSADACYYTSIEQIALPPGDGPAFPNTLGSDAGKLRVIALTPETGDIYDFVLEEDATAMASGLVAMKGDKFIMSSVESNYFGFPVQPEVYATGLEEGDAFKVIIDAVYNYALAPVSYRLAGARAGAAPLPVDGETVMFASLATNPENSFYTTNLFTFDTTGGALTHMDLAVDAPVTLRVFDRDINLLAEVTGVTDFDDEYLRFATDGLHYVQLFVPGSAAGDTFALTGTVDEITPATLAIGTTATAGLPASGDAFFDFATGGAKWIAFTGGGLAPTGPAEVGFYDVDAIGWLDHTVLPSFTRQVADTLVAAPGRITVDDAAPYLVRIHATDGSTQAELVIFERDYADLGMADDAAPIEVTDAGRDLPFLVTARDGDVVTVTVEPQGAMDVVLRQLDIDEGTAATINDAGAAEAETFTATVGVDHWVAFAIDSAGGDSPVDITITTVSPPRYEITSGVTPFVDACGGGANVLPQTAFGADAAVGDEAVSAELTLPFAIDLHGVPVTSLRVHTNGFVAFTTLNPALGYYFPAQLPSIGGPVGMLAPYWTDLADVTLCKAQDATSMTLQWQGHVYQGTDEAEMQLILHSSGRIEFVWGDGHQLDGSDGSVGTEAVDESYGQSLVFGEAGAVAPGSSVTLTPEA